MNEMNEIYNLLSNIKTILLKENIEIQIKDIEEDKLEKFYIDLNNLYGKPKSKTAMTDKQKELIVPIAAGALTLGVLYLLFYKK
jgi:hypothetical protein